MNDKKTSPASDSSDPTRERIAKVIARHGLCSRRDAEKWIESGRVKVNGIKLLSPAFTVISEDTIEVDNVKLDTAPPSRLFRFHKPNGMLTTHKDPEGRPTVFEGLPSELPRLISIGRLDMTSEGLLLLTTDGALARKLELPATGLVRTYRARVNVPTKVDLSQSLLDLLQEGVTVDGINYGSIEAVLDPKGEGKTNRWITVKLTEGKNREVRHVLASLGLTVNRLIRTTYGPFELGDLPAKALQEIPVSKWKKMLNIQK